MGPDIAREWSIEQGISAVGRRPSNQVVLTDPSVSRQHFSIRAVDEQFSLINHSASQGTYVNGMRVDGELQLNHADQIQVGGTVLVFHVQELETGTAFSTDESAPDAIPIPAQSDAMPISGPSGPMPAATEDEFDAVADPLQASLIGLADQAAQGQGAADSRLNEQIRLIHEIGQQLVAELDLKALFAMILEKVFTLIPVDTGHVLLFDPKARQVDTVAVRNSDGSTTPTDQKPSRSLVLFSVRNRKGVLSADTQSDERFSEELSIISRGIKSAMCVPMLYQEETLGVIYVDNYMSGYTFTQDDLNLLAILANQAAIAVRNAKLLRQIVSEETKRNNLARYLAPQLVETIADEDHKLELGGKLVNAAIMETDIRGFTALSEPMAPGDVVHMLNTYFTEMTEIVFETKGTMDKYVGDALLAAWGSPVPDPEASVNALRAAVKMQRRLPDIHFSMGKPFQIGIGLHYGEVLHGNLGSEKIMQYTVIGDTVNTAARLCDRAAPGKILMSKAFMDSLGRAIPTVELEPMQFKGKSEPMRVFEFCSPQEQPSDPGISTPTPIAGHLDGIADATPTPSPATPAPVAVTAKMQMPIIPQGETPEPDATDPAGTMRPIPEETAPPEVDTNPPQQEDMPKEDAPIETAIETVPLKPSPDETKPPLELDSIEVEPNVDAPPAPATIAPANPPEAATPTEPLADTDTSTDTDTSPAPEDSQHPAPTASSDDPIPTAPLNPPLEPPLSPQLSPPLNPTVNPTPDPESTPSA